MKKTIMILTAVISVGVLARGTGYHMNGTGSMSGSRGMMVQYDNLTEQQQTEFNKLHTEHRNDMHRSMLDIKEIDLQIQKELLAEKPDQKKIDSLIDKKTKLNAQHQKDMLEFRLQMKEKFNIEMTGGRQGNRMGM